MIPIGGGYTAYSADECSRLRKLLHKLEQESALIKGQTSPHLRRVLDVRISDVARRLSLLMAMSPNEQRAADISKSSVRHRPKAH